jgi:general stress protein YciG
MAGTKLGGLRAASTNRTRHGGDFYARIGSKGGKLGRTGGFYANRDLARRAGQVGGRISRRTKRLATV